MKTFGFHVLLAGALATGAGCSKSATEMPPAPVQKAEAQEALRNPELNKAERTAPTGFQTFTIQAGNHFCDQNIIRSVTTSEMKFAVRFDSSAIYTTKLSSNQADINKLYGFSEGWNNQFNSARIGWNWYNGALRLHAYVYNKGVRSYREIRTVPIGSDITCSIRVAKGSYIFTVNGISVTMTRGATTTAASGLMQYPYFGGDEVAPKRITILIRNL